MAQNVVGQTYFLARFHTFVRVISVQKELVPDQKDSDSVRSKAIVVQDLQSGSAMSGYVLDDLGSKLLPVPDGFGKEKVERYLEAARVYESAADTMMNLEVELYCRFQECKTCGNMSNGTKRFIKDRSKCEECHLSKCKECPQSNCDECPQSSCKQK